MNTFLGFFIFIQCYFAIIGAQQFTDCGSVMGKVKNVTIIPPCGKVCTLTSGTNVSISIQFLSYEVAKQVTAVVHGVIGKVPIRFPLPQPNACIGSGLNCPLEKGAFYTYHNVLQILKSYPKISLQVQWELIDESNKDLVCVLIPAQIR